MNRHHPQSRRERGFTLIELLVVIAIIAVLVGITMPTLGNARETARRTKCTANLRSQGLGMQLYLDEHKGVLPLTRPLYNPDYDPDSANPDGSPSPNSEPHLINILAPYLQIGAPVVDNGGQSPRVYTQVSDVLRCPSDLTGKDQATGFEPVWRGNAWSYSYFAGDLMVAAEFLTIPPKVMAESVTKVYEQIRWKDLPVIFDFDDWHPLRKGPNRPPRNCVYFGDWHADWATDLTRYQNQSLRVDQVWQQLVCDIGRFGGLRLPGCP